MSQVKRFIEAKADELAELCSENNGIPVTNELIDDAFRTITFGCPEADTIWDAPWVDEYLKKLKS